MGYLFFVQHVDNGVARGAGNDYSVPMTYRVVQTIQSITGDDAPVEVQFYTGDNHAKAISALVSAAVDNSDSEWYNVLSVRIDMEA